MTILYGKFIKGDRRLEWFATDFVDSKTKRSGRFADSWYELFATHARDELKNLGLLLY